MLIEPRFEKVFLPNSYAYRPEKGHTKAVRFTLNIFRNKKYPYALRLDIDNYFDNIDHKVLFTIRSAFGVIPFSGNTVFNSLGEASNDAFKKTFRFSL